MHLGSRCAWDGYFRSKGLGDSRVTCQACTLGRAVQRRICRRIRSDLRLSEGFGAGRAVGYIVRRRQGEHERAQVGGMFAASVAAAAAAGTGTGRAQANVGSMHKSMYDTRSLASLTFSSPLFFSGRPGPTNSDSLIATAGILTVRRILGACRTCTRS